MTNNSSETFTNNSPYIKGEKLMEWYRRIFGSSVAKKLIMSITGLFLCTFLVIHLFGNLFLFWNDSGEMFNKYSEFMSTNIIIRIIEIVLFLGFFFHIVDGLILAYMNKQTRPITYKVYKRLETSSMFSRIMFWSGILILLFLIIHLNTFYINVRLKGADITMYNAVVNAFSDPVYSIFYVVSMVFLIFHLNHGFQSGFQTLGLNNKKYFPFIKGFGTFFAIFMSIGFASMPIYFLIRSLSGGN